LQGTPHIEVISHIDLIDLHGYPLHGWDRIAAPLAESFEPRGCPSFALFVTGGKMLRGLIGAFLVQGLACSAALAGGTCILHPQPFKLRSDTIHWSIKIRSGEQCIQGLRWSTIMIDKVSIIEPPKAGRSHDGGTVFPLFR
jgi:hypothetical protein